MRKSALHSSILVASALWACGGDGQGASSSSGVEASTQISALTDEQAQKLCAFDRDGYKAHLPGEAAYCTYFAANGDDVARCEEDRDECIASDDYENELADTWDCDSAKAEDYNGGLEGECEATVGELEACLKADHGSRAGEMKAAKCGENADDDGGLSSLPEPCVHLEDVCPGLLDELG